MIFQVVETPENPPFSVAIPDWAEDLRRRIWSCNVVCDFGIETKMLLYSSIREVNGMKLCVPTESEDYNIYNPGYAQKKHWKITLISSVAKRQDALSSPFNHTPRTPAQPLRST